MEPFSKKWNHFQKEEQFFEIGTFSKKGTILKNRNYFLNQTILTKEPFWRNKKRKENGSDLENMKNKYFEINLKKT